MSEAELIFTALAELSTRQIAETMKAVGMKENKVAGKTGGGIARKQGENSKQRREGKLLRVRASFRRLRAGHYPGKVIRK